MIPDIVRQFVGRSKEQRGANATVDRTRRRSEFIVLVATAIAFLFIFAAPPGDAQECGGDCNGNGVVTVDELVKAVNIALGTADIGTCAAADRNGDGVVTVDELVFAVNNALTGCAGAPTATPEEPTHTPEPTQVPSPTPTATPGPADLFPASLHYRRVGKRVFYEGTEAHPGFFSLTGISYDSLACGKCHGANYADGTPISDATYEPGCRDCHADPANPDREQITDQICLACHSRQQSEINLYPDGDVHRAAGLKCIDCHGAGQVHGTGVEYESLLDLDAPRADCARCHPSLPSNQYHSIHKEKVYCAACHMQGAVTCYQCHFDSEVGDAKIKRWYPPNPSAAPGKPNGIPRKGFKFLLNYAGKVWPATMMSLVYEGDGAQVKKFYVLAPYYAHTIKKDAVKSCGDCHASGSGTNTAMTEYRNTGQITVTRLDEAQVLQGPTGVIPVPPDYSTAFKLQWFFYEGDPDSAATDPNLWTPVSGDADLTQILSDKGFGTPLTAEQIQKLGGLP